jgi:hypothetical protein
MIINPEELDVYDNLCQDSEKVKKYKMPGVYCIKINDKIVYIGQSSEMLYRLA